MVKVYLAGKIAPHEHDWRRHIIDDVGTYRARRQTVGPRTVHTIGKIATQHVYTYDDLSVGWEWPARPSRIPGIDITGPYFIEGEGHDGQHGPGLHGVGSYDAYCAGEWGMSRRRAARTAKLCREAIKSSDVVFSWFGNPSGSEDRAWMEVEPTTAFGTIFEVGYAVALGKKVVVASPVLRDWEDAVGECQCTGGHGCACGGTSLREDLWLTFAHADAFAYQPRPQDALIEGLAKLAFKVGVAPVESPAEASFYEAAKQRIDVTPQYKTGPYRLDFAIVHKRVGIEIDGLTYHNGQESFIKDQQRQRDLQSRGWTIIRFAAKEALDKPEWCVSEVERLLAG